MTNIFKTALLAGTFLGSLVPAMAQDEPTIDPSQLRIINPSPVVKDMNAAAVANGLKSATAEFSINAVSPTLKTFMYTVNSPRDGQSYTGSIVGADPRNNGARTTSIEMVVIPLRIELTGTVRTWDATVADPGCLTQGGANLSALQQFLASPLVNAVNNMTINGQNIGNVNFVDGFQRAQFWRTANGAAPLVQTKPAYHVALPITVKPVQTITTANNAAGNGASFSFTGACGSNAATAVNPGTRYAAMNINFIDAQLQTIIANLGLNPSQFPLFVAYGMFMTDGPPGSLSGNCCILGYHNSTTFNVANPGQTYGISNYFPNSGAPGLFGNVTDVVTVTHEILEWVNDPSGNNLVPEWGNIGQVGGCAVAGTGQDNLEVGDPMSGTNHPGVLMPNGVTYFMQENAFFTWFLGNVAFQGAGGRYSSNGTFSGFAKNCPPGGTF